MISFEERYNKLNEKQKKAVDTTEGPVLVVAGPGSGKTELLSLRVANILRQGQVGPQNILCLTFTNSGASNMRERLAQFIGADAYRVGIFTFHSFCSHIISRFPEYFYNAATFSIVPDVIRAEILESIFASLPHGHPLGGFHPETGYVYLRDAKDRIKHIKNAGFTPVEFSTVLEQTLAEYDDVHTTLMRWPDSLRSKKSLVDVRVVLEMLQGLRVNSTASMLASTLVVALEKAESDQKVEPVRQWRDMYTVKTDQGRVLKEYEKVDKMRALVGIYQSYTDALHGRGYYDYDDMIIDVGHALHTHESLRAEIEEQYQYILIDEFQDTNEAQMNLVRAITANPVHEGMPNVCVVGDDDQAIYKFQGAEMSHMMRFRDSLYKNVQTIVLDKNYRSTPAVLDLARSVITQGKIRLENKYQDMSKMLTSENKNLPQGNVKIAHFDSDLEEYGAVVKKISEQLRQGVPAYEIAILAREHKQLKRILPHLDAAGIPYVYKKSGNVFDESHIRELVTVCEYLASGLRYEGSRADLLPRILSFAFFGISRMELFLLAEKVKKENISWAQALAENKDEKIRSVFELLATLAVDANTLPLEHVLDRFMHASGFKEYYFGADVRVKRASDYVHFLTHLKTFIDALREHKGGEVLHVSDVGPFVEMHKGYDIPLVVQSQYAKNTNAISLFSAHDAKGLEFGSVYIISAHDRYWAKPSRERNKISIPIALRVAISPAGDDEDDFIRILYVAITRAKHTLHISTHDTPVRYLVGEVRGINTENEDTDDVATTEVDLIPLHEQGLGLFQLPYTEDEKTVFARLVEEYQMPVTHLTNFLNVAEGGPQLFLERNLLRFPAPLNPSGAYGDAVHKAIEEIVTYPRYFGGTKPTLEHVIGVFDTRLTRARLPKIDDVRERARGHALLATYYTTRSDFFRHTDQVEVDMKHEGVVVHGAHLTGKLDFVRIDDGMIYVRDFKTGKAFTDWDRVKSDHEKIKLHNQKMQLIFYKILIDYSHRFQGSKIHSLVLEYVEGDTNGAIVELPLIPLEEDVDRLQRLIGVVYKKIISLDFPNTEHYSKDYKGILAFEEDLLQGNI